MTNDVYIVTQTDFRHHEDDEGSQGIVGVYSTWEVAVKAAKWHAKDAAGEDMWDDTEREQTKDGWTVWQRDGDRDHSDIRIEKRAVYDDFADSEDEYDDSEQNDDAQDEGTQDEDEGTDDDERAQPPPAKRQKVQG